MFFRSWLFLDIEKIDTAYQYVRLHHQIYKNQQLDRYVTRIAATKEERCNLINDGWSLVEKEGNDWYFGRPK